MDGFKDLFQGGLCNPNMQAQQSNNAFKALMNSMNAQTAVHPMMGQITPEQNLNLMMQNMDVAWNQEQAAFQQIQMQRQMAMAKAWEMERMRQEQMQTQMIQAKAMEEQFRQSQVGAMAPQMAMGFPGAVFMPTPMGMPMRYVTVSSLGSAEDPSCPTDD